MVNFPGRNGRRRRVLNEEVLSASTSHVALRAMSRDDEAGDAPRYSDAAGVENHPQVTDFVPRRYRTIALMVLSGVVTASVLGLLQYFQSSLAAQLGIESATTFDMRAGGSLSAWVQSIALLVASAVCLLTYSIRRHRIDDIRGRYRIWLATGGACLFLSANCIAGLHQVAADVLTHLTGWTALREGAIWWLALGGLPIIWIVVRALLDIRESRLSVSLFIGAVICYVVGTVSFLGMLPITDPRAEAIVSGVTVLMGYWLVFVAAVAQARFVILDAQGLITISPRVVRQRKSRSATPSAAEDAERSASRDLSCEVSGKRHSARPVQASNHASTEQWVDGTRPERDPYSDDRDGDDDAPDDDRKLSKSERKRLRKLKSQYRAA